MKSKFPHYYNASLKTFDKAKELRKESTPAEKHLWKLLRNRNILGFKFRRQHPIYRFIADFYCDEAKLIIEADGGIHQLEDNKQYDAEREEAITSLGITVLRFTNEEILTNDKNVVSVLKNYLSKIKQHQE